MSAANSSNITTIQILRSYSNTTPSTLQDGQLAYSFKSNTLFIGSNTGGVIAISDQTTANLAANLANSKLANTGTLITVNGASQLYVSNTQTSTSTTTGALTVGGGLGVIGNVNIGGTVIGGGIRTTSSATAPTGNTVGDIWYNTVTDTTYRYSFDGTTRVWLDITGPSTVFNTQVDALTANNLTLTGNLAVIQASSFTGNVTAVNITATNITGNLTGNVTGNLTGTSVTSNIYYTSANSSSNTVSTVKVVPAANLIYTVVNSTVSFVEFNFQPWLNTYKRFILSINNIDFNLNNSQRFYYLQYSYNTTGAQSFFNSPASLVAVSGGTMFTNYGGAITGASNYTSSSILYWFSFGRTNNSNFANPYGTCEFPNNYLTGLPGFVKTQMNYINNSNLTCQDMQTEIVPINYYISGIRVYSSLGSINQGTFTVYGVDPI